jgi:hypothetical protein
MAKIVSPVFGEVGRRRTLTPRLIPTKRMLIRGLGGRWCTSAYKPAPPKRMATQACVPTTGTQRSTGSIVVSAICPLGSSKAELTSHFTSTVVAVEGPLENGMTILTT